ncbi:hypothetical protein [Laspinema palackyanum]|uniref:hypothetical protein n=1 Tax=Laspinema palackyanum TaxID=3231601 RepID=UPI00345D0A5C|nr:hypothetical protein [Laspinema sp. D2c]
MLRGCHPGIPTPGCDDKAFGGQGTEGDRLSYAVSKTGRDRSVSGASHPPQDSGTSACSLQK